MQTGTVTNFVHDKGFGFIHTEDREDDLFFHISEVDSDSEIRKGDTVEFEMGQNDKGKNKGKPCAKKVRVVNWVNWLNG